MPDPGVTRALDDEEREGLAMHGIAGPRGQVAPVPGRSGRFGRLFPELAPADIDREMLDRLATAMVLAAGGSVANLGIPAGYTYLAQFVDHDLTFDPNSRMETSNDPYTLVDFRTPRLDLDSVYGSGPMDQPFLYRWNGNGGYPGLRLLVAESGSNGRARFDLPRNDEGRALIGDSRNDENVIISQLHTLFLRFHNRVIDDLLRARAPGNGRIAAVVFEDAQRQVRWHYQWLVLNDLLPKIVGEPMKTSVLADSAAGPPVITRQYFRWQNDPFMPVEFSGAAYRFGHSLVRPDYRVKLAGDSLPIVAPPGNGAQLGGFRRVPKALEIEWRMFFPLERDVFAQRAMTIDPFLSRALAHLPPDDASLVKLNLKRGDALGLPAGRDVARAMSEEPLSDAELLPKPIALDDDLKQAVLHAAPLWYYVLCEALAKGEGKHLGPVGGRIVAEVLVGLVHGDPGSYLRQDPRWRPAEAGLFIRPIETMADLVEYVQSA